MCNPAQELSNAFGSIGDAIDSVANGIGNAVERFIEDPLPIIETIALTYFLGPAGAGFSTASAAAMSSAAVSAANGGSIEDIALAAATSYIGGEIGSAAGAEAASSSAIAEMTVAEQAMIKQVVTSSSSAAATTALRGGDFNQILASGVSGGVNSYVRAELAAQGFTQVDNKLVANAVSSATNAILRGKSVEDAVGQSIAATAISAGLQGKIDQLNKNNELGASLSDKFTSLKQSADDYFVNNKIDELQAQAQKEYAAATTARDTYNSLKSEFDTAYKTYNDNKALFEADKSNRTAYDAANAAAATVNGLSQKVIDAADAANATSTTYSSTMSVLQPLQTEYNTTYAAPLNDINAQITDFNAQQTALAKDVGESTAKYQDQLKLDAEDLQKQINDKAAADLAAQQLERQNALDAGDWKKAYAFDKTGYDPTELGITDANWKENQQKLQDLYITQGGFTKDWQQVGTDKVHLYTDGTGIGVNENGEAYKLDADQVAQMIWNGQVTTANSGYTDRPVDTRGYYNEVTGQYVYNPSGTLAAPLDNASGTNLASMEGYKYDPEKKVWTTPAGETVDLGYLPASGQAVSGSDLTGATPAKPISVPSTAAAAKPLPKATATGLQAAANQTNVLGLLSLLGSMGGGDSGAQQAQAQPTVAPEAQIFDWSAPLETNPFKQNSSTDVSGATKMARGGSIDDLVALLKRG